MPVHFPRDISLVFLFFSLHYIARIHRMPLLSFFCTMWRRHKDNYNTKLVDKPNSFVWYIKSLAYHVLCEKRPKLQMPVYCFFFPSTFRAPYLDQTLSDFPRSNVWIFLCYIMMHEKVKRKSKAKKRSKKWFNCIFAA